MLECKSIEETRSVLENAIRERIITENVYRKMIIEKCRRE